MGHGHGVGENPNFFLGHRQDLLDLGECSRLVHGEEVVPPLVIAEMQQQEFLIGRQFVIVVLDPSKISFDTLHFFCFEVLENPANDRGPDSNGSGHWVKSFESTMFVHQAIGGILFRKFLQDVLVPDLGKVNGNLHSLERSDGR